MIAVASTATEASRMPPKIVGSASGNSIKRTICSSLMPCPRAASTRSRSTWRTPTYVFVRIGGIASRISAKQTFVKPVPRNATKNAMIASDGTARPMFATLPARNWPLPMCPSHSASGIAMAMAINTATDDTRKWFAARCPISPRPPTSTVPARDSRASKMKLIASPSVLAMITPPPPAPTVSAGAAGRAPAGPGRPPAASPGPRRRRRWT